ncbi:STAS domain-containing protein [bacterium]|nr:STAS domain-containing protein [bacterium]
MSIKLLNEEDVAVIGLLGDIDMQEVVNIRNTIASVLDSGCNQLVLDLSRVQHINATGMGILTESLRRIRHLQGDMKLAGVNPYVENIFELTGIKRFFEIHATRGDAVKSFKRYKYAAA